LLLLFCDHLERDFHENHTVVRFRSVSVLALAAGLSTLCPAQQPAANTYRVTISHVKPDMINEWLDLQKNEMFRRSKKAGVPSRTVVSTFFGNANEYVQIQPFQKWADFDGPSPLVRRSTHRAQLALTESSVSAC